MSQPRSSSRYLSAQDEDKIIKEWRKQTMKECDAFVKAFAECSQGRTVSIAWACRDQNKAMNDCLRTYRTQDRLDAIRQKLMDEKQTKLQVASPNEP
ncbi:hypothetical protein H4R34_002239 [Dimargaris verticillata]|uniref:COX assembly mitochondrial protein n=1 Tax=Dimargaris verticillata TaxID=2761393 RepID=A0A9W8B351_9FUNG|nr:hypothetical protein H4R34_002239 [Dimargaris verticillata]